MRRVILKWVVRPPTTVRQDQDMKVNEEDLWVKILLRLKDMGLVKDRGNCSKGNE